MTAAFASSRLGFGCANLPRNRQEALALLETALDAGISHFDTARMYGNGDAESVLGELARRRRADMVIVSKAGIAPPSLFGRVVKKAVGAAAPSLMAAGSPRFGLFAPGQVRASVETSLRELQTERLDALLLHEIEPHQVSDELKRELETLKDAGKIARFGLATSRTHSEAITAADPSLNALVQIPAGPVEGPAPPIGALTIIHSVLGPRLHGFMAKMGADRARAGRLLAETGVDAANADQVAGLLLMLEMARNPGGVVLFSTTSPARVQASAALLAANADGTVLAPLQRFLAQA